MEIKTLGIIAKSIVDYGITIILSATFIYFTIKSFNKWLDGVAKKNQLFQKMGNKIDDLDNKLEDMKKDFNFMRERFQITTVNIIETIYDNRKVSDKEFILYATTVNSNTAFYTLLKIIENLDENSLFQKSRFDTLISNILSLFDKMKVDCKHRILDRIKYSVDKLDKFSMGYENIFDAFIIKLKEEYLDELNYEKDLKNDAHFFACKNELKNRTYKFINDINEMIKESSKGCE